MKHNILRIRDLIETPTILVGLFLLIIASPIAIEIGESGVVLGLLWSFMMLACVISASHNKLATSLVSLLAVSWVALSYLDIGVSGALAPAVAFCVVFITMSISFTKILNADRVDLTTICRALSVYLLMGLAWTSLYTCIYMLNSSAFAFEGLDDGEVAINLMYYSYVTLTTLGYGDITPLSLIVKVFSATEAILGTFYLTVLVARLVSLYRD